jgi:hypothetical protein
MPNDVKDPSNEGASEEESTLSAAPPMPPGRAEAGGGTTRPAVHQSAPAPPKIKQVSIPSGQRTDPVRQIYILIVYYFILLLFNFWFLLDIWSSGFTLLRWIGIREQALADPLLRTINFTIIGGFIGSILYQIRIMFHFHTAGRYDPRWFGKYLTAPWEAGAMALVVLALIRGGVSVFGGSTGTDVTAVNNFAAFGTGALVGFGMRDVVGWLGNLVQTMFSSRGPGD